MIPLGGELKAWALTVTGYGTVLEVDSRQAMKEAKLFDGRGRSVTVTEMRPVVEAEQSNVLLWNELMPGDYWVFHMAETFIERDPRPDLERADLEFQLENLTPNASYYEGRHDD